MTGLLHPYHLAWWRRTLRRRAVVTDWNRRANAIFVHIPKTAGTSVLAAIGAEPVFDTHAPAQTYRERYPELFARAYLFAFVRNPWDRFASAFHFLKSGTDWPMQREWAARHIGDMDFQRFTEKLEEPLHRARVLSERFFWPQTFWLGGVGRPSLVPDLYRFEAIDAELARLCARLGTAPPARAPHLRKVREGDFRSLYTPRMVELVGRLYRDDAARLGYAFE